MAEITAGIIGLRADSASLTHCQCTIAIANECTNYSLFNARMHIVSGSCAVPLPPSIPPSKSVVAQFIKTPHTARGSVGVFTYDLLKKDADQPTERMAVMFSVPYDFNLYSNWYAVGIFEKSQECDYDLYYKMYNKADQSFMRDKASTGNCLIHKGDHVTMMATMSDSYQPVIKIQVTDAMKNIVSE